MRQLLIIMGICSLLSSACTNILDKEPLGRLDADLFLQTKEDAVQAVNAAYGPLMFNSANSNFYWAFGVLASDHAVVGGDGSRPGLTEIDFMTHTPRTQEFNDFWKLNYKGIVQCNLLIEKVPQVNMDVTLRNQYLGEALFLRAYYYFLLTQVYGDVPMMLTLLSPDELKLPRTSKSVIWDQIILDCEQAASLLPASYSALDAGRATKGAALSLAAKTSLYQKNYQKTLDYIAQVKGLGVYQLMADYQDNFRKETQNNSESVWEIQHTNLELGVGNSLNQWWASKKFGFGYGFAEVTREYLDEFEAGDPRRKFTIAINNDPYFGLIWKPSFSSTGYGPVKYLQSDQEASQKADGDINYTAIRYAEVLLWEAEAMAELGRTAEALVPLEEVRARARAQAVNPATALPPVTTTDKTELINAIRHERSVELGFEMHHFFDLIRWGLAADRIDGFIPGKHEVFPLPQIEMDLNSSLIQNPGY